ncbi:MAG: hypothetical protein R3C31_03120 [Hyphomonadaceae bacterium]
MIVYFNVSNAPVPDEAGPVSRLFLYAPLYGCGLAIPAVFVVWIALSVIGAVAPGFSPTRLMQTFDLSENDLAQRLYAACAIAITVIAAVAQSSEAQRRVPVYGLTMGELNGALQRLRHRLHAPDNTGHMWGWLNLAIALGAWWLADQTDAWRDLREHVGSALSAAAVIAIAVANALRLLSAGPSASRSAASLGLRALPVLAALATWVMTALLLSMLLLLVLRDKAGDGGVALIVLSSLFFGGFAAYRAARLVDDKTSYRASRLGAGTASDRLRGDRRKLVLFLRSFKDDTARAASVDTPKDAQRDFIALENVIAQSVNYGPLIAIGQPGVIPKGIPRDFYDGEEWRDAVTRWMHEALLIVMVAGYTEGVRWEFEQIIAKGHARKLILIFPPNDSHFEARWAWVRRLLGTRLFGPEMERAKRQDTILLTMDSSENLCVMTSRSKNASAYRAALALAVYGKLVRTG